MSSINNVGSNSPIQKVANPVIQKQAPTTESARPSASDRVELSGVSHLLSALKNNSIRTDKVADIKAQIQAGTYDEDSKLDSVLDNVLEDLNK